MGIFFDHGIVYLIPILQKDIALENRVLKEIIGNIKYYQLRDRKFLVVIPSRDTDSRLVKSSIYTGDEWISNTSPFVSKISLPDDFKVYPDEIEKIKKIEEYTGIKGDWYEANIINTTY